MTTLNVSFIKLKKDIKSDYTKSLKNWKHKQVQWKDMKNVLSNSKVQFSYLKWKNGAKTKSNVITDDVNFIALDCDDGMTIQEVQKILKNYNYIIGTSKSHMIEKKGLVCQRFRVIVPVVNASKDIAILLRSIRLVFPWNDEQTETETGAFLGNDNAIIIYNNTDRNLCLFKANELAKTQLGEEAREKAKSKAKKIDSDLRDTHYNCNLEMIKEQITLEIACEVVESLGFTVERRNKFKLRKDESTASCKIHNDGYCKDYGGDFSGDLFQLVVEYGQMNFGQSIKYIRNFI